MELQELLESLTGDSQELDEIRKEIRKFIDELQKMELNAECAIENLQDALMAIEDLAKNARLTEEVS